MAEIPNCPVLEGLRIEIHIKLQSIQQECDLSDKQIAKMADISARAVFPTMKAYTNNALKYGIENLRNYRPIQEHMDHYLEDNGF